MKPIDEAGPTVEFFRQSSSGMTLERAYIMSRLIFILNSIRKSGAFPLVFALALGLVIAAILASAPNANRPKQEPSAHIGEPPAVTHKDFGRCNSPACNHGKRQTSQADDQNREDPDGALANQHQAPVIPVQAPASPVKEAELQPFKNWLTEWQAGRGKLEEGVRLAKQQEPVMQGMINEAPDLACSHAMMEKDWKKLPASLRAHVAHRFTRTGEYSKIDY